MKESRKIASVNTDYVDQHGTTNGKVFPNGFGSWMETHYEISAAIAAGWAEEDHNNIPQLVRDCQGGGGHGFLYLLSEAMTDEFESMHKDTQWSEKGHPGFYPAIEKFIESTLKEPFNKSHRYYPKFY